VKLLLMAGVLATRTALAAAPDLTLGTVHGATLSAPMQIVLLLTVMTLLPAVIIGLRLKLTACRRILPLIAISAVLQLICKPFLIYWLAGWAQLPPPEKTVLTILSTMPSGLVPAAFAANYNCAPDETSAIIFVNVALSAITIPVLLSILL